MNKIPDHHTPNSNAPLELLSVVIPCYNERETVLDLLRKVEAVDLGNISKQIVIIDDASTDGTSELLKKYAGEHELLFNRQNMGKGASLRKGFERCRGQVVLVQDADLEYDPEDYPKLLQPILQGLTNVVYGSRILHKDNHRHSTLSFYLGGRLVTMVTNLLYGSQLTDEPTCYKVFRRDLLTQIPLTCKGFEFCPEITAKLIKRGEKIIEVPIHYYPRKPSEGKKIKWWDGLEAIKTLVRFRFG